MIFDMYFVAIGLKMAHVNTKWDVSWPKMPTSWFKLTRRWTKLVPDATKLGTSWLGMTVLRGFRGPKQALGPSQGVQGGTNEAPRMHQGCTRDAPRRHQGGTK